MAETAAPHRPARHEYVVLDGLRGIAALAVGIYHAVILNIPAHPFMPTYLGVDFFFCLSGFVLSFAYSERIESGRMSQRAFFAVRFQRLYPMILAGVALGFLLYLPGLRMSLHTATLSTIGSVLLVPVGLFFGEEAYPLNTPLWSLLFEFVAGIAFGLLARFGQRVWLVVAAFSALILALAAFRYSGLANLGHVGFGRFAMGLPRVMTPFAFGVIIQRAMGRGVPASRLSISLFWPAALLCFLLFALRPEGALSNLVGVLLIVPVIIVLGVRAKPGRALGVLRVLGRLSYPFYALHSPILWFAKDHSEGLSAEVQTASAAAALFAAVVLALVLERWYDRPARALLGRLFGGRRAVAAGSRA